MTKAQLLSKFRHHIISKMTTVIGNDSLRNTKTSDDMDEKEKCCSLPSIIECRHCLDPL
jgi:hypothetical protein